MNLRGINDYQGWIADIDEDATGTYKWQPSLQLNGWAPSLSVWFETEEACLQFIRTEVIGQKEYPGEEPA